MEIKYKVVSLDTNRAVSLITLRHNGHCVEDKEIKSFCLIGGSKTLLQYIGLKDKHGNEIYLNDDFKYKHAKLTVDFKNGAFGYNYAGMFLSFCILIDEGDFTIIDNCIQEIEVLYE